MPARLAHPWTPVRSRSSLTARPAATVAADRIGLLFMITCASKSSEPLNPSEQRSNEMRSDALFIWLNRLLQKLRRLSYHPERHYLRGRPSGLAEPGAQSGRTRSFK